MPIFIYTYLLETLIKPVALDKTCQLRDQEEIFFLCEVYYLIILKCNIIIFVCQNNFLTNCISIDNCVRSIAWENAQIFLQFRRYQSRPNLSRKLHIMQRRVAVSASVSEYWMQYNNNNNATWTCNRKCILKLGNNIVCRIRT